MINILVFRIVKLSEDVLLIFENRWLVLLVKVILFNMNTEGESSYYCKYNKTTQGSTWEDESVLRIITVAFNQFLSL